MVILKCQGFIGRNNSNWVYMNNSASIEEKVQRTLVITHRLGQ